MKIFCTGTKWSCTDKCIVVSINARYKNVVNKNNSFHIGQLKSWLLPFPDN